MSSCRCWFLSSQQPCHRCFVLPPPRPQNVSILLTGKGRQFIALSLSQSTGQMESATRSPACSVPSVLVGLTRLCKLTKVCAAPALDRDEATTTKSGLAGDFGGYDQRLVLVRLFEATATLKSAYIKLQRAHILYDPAKMALADETIVSELDSVAALQCLCSSNKSCSIGPLINERWSLVQELDAEMRRRDSDIVLLKRELEGLQRENARLNKQIKSENNPKRSDKAFYACNKKELVTTTTSSKLLVEMFKAAAASVHEFAGLVATSLASSSDGRVAEQSRKRCSFEAHLSRVMIGGGGGTGCEKQGEGEEEQISAAQFDGIMRSCDPLDALTMQHPTSSFSRFCQTKYLAAVPSEMEAAMLGNLEQRAFVSRGGHPRTWFYRAFAGMARSAWALRVLMEKYRSAGWRLTMFYARRGSKYEGEAMESVNKHALFRHGEAKMTVAFSVTPGLKVGDTTVVACRVFLCHPE